MRKPCCCRTTGAPYAIAFGLGLIISCFCPIGLTTFIMAIIIIWLGWALLRP